MVYLNFFGNEASEAIITCTCIMFNIKKRFKIWNSFARCQRTAYHV